MSKLSDIRRIVPEDFQRDHQQTVSKLADSYNHFCDELYPIVNGQIDFDNMTRRKVQFDVVIGTSGSISGNNAISTNLAYVSGINIIKFDNLSSSSTRPTSSPFLNFTYKGSGRLVVDYIAGLPAGKWRLILEIIQ